MDDYYKPKYGPIHFAAIGFNRTNVVRGMVEQLDLVREAGIIRLIDFLFVEKDDYGNIKALETTDLSHDEKMEFGAVVGGLIGLGAAGEEGMIAGMEAGAEAVAENDFGLSVEDIREVADDIPRGASAMLVLFEHTWALGIKEYALNNGGFLIAQGLLHPAALIGVGAELARAIEAEQALELEEAHEEEEAEKVAATGTKKRGTSTKKMKTAKSTTSSKSSTSARKVAS